MNNHDPFCIVPRESGEVKERSYIGAHLVQRENAGRESHAKGDGGGSERRDVPEVDDPASLFLENVEKGLAEKEKKKKRFI